MLCLFGQGERRPKRRRKMLHDLSGVGSVGIVARGPLDEYRFNMFMRDLLAEKAKDIFRCKGVLAVHVSTAWLGGRLGKSAGVVPGWAVIGLVQQWARCPHMD
jgi:G3E family GTPase